MICNRAFMALILVGYAHCALSAPPSAHASLFGEPNGVRNASAWGMFGASRRLVAAVEVDRPLPGAHGAGAGRLDLSLPDDMHVAALRPEATESMARGGADADERLSDLHAAYANGVKAETLESTVARYRRDGVPLARLWENKSALVSLGLNGRGKPGLWLVQKIH